MSELLKIFIDFDLLEDGVILTMEYIDAVMDSFTGQESTKFSLKVYYYFYATVKNRRCDAHKQCLAKWNYKVSAHLRLHKSLKMAYRRKSIFES
jgi:hypothetical protein